MKEYKKYFSTVINLYFPDNYAEIISLVDSNYIYISKDTTFALTSKNPIDKRLDFCSYFLALIKTLDKRGESFEHIRKICLDIVTEYVRPKSIMQSKIKLLLPKLINTWLGQKLIKSFQSSVGKNANKDGFIAQIITDKNETFGLGYGFDILECGICKLFMKHNYAKYASILCEVDEITSSLAGLQLIRTGTIANGASKCDFRFKRKEY